MFKISSSKEKILEKKRNFKNGKILTCGSLLQGMMDPKLRAVAYLREGAVAQPAFIEPTAATCREESF